MEPYEKIAKILRTDKDYVRIASEKLARVTSRKEVLSKIVEENTLEMATRLDHLKVKTLRADSIYKSLIRKVTRDDHALFEHFRRPVCDNETGCLTLLNFAKELSGVGKGYFLKRAKAVEFLTREPPPHILSFFKMKNIDALLARYDLFEVYSALRFVEDKDWLNDIFFKQLEKVAPEDFEEREIELHVLHEEWLSAAEKFLKKKYHNVSHLKELGIIFVIPLKIAIPGETMRLFTLILHYLHEVIFYSDLFKKYSRENHETFSAKLISALRGDVIDARFPETERGQKWMIVQRYLAKDDPFDWRLFEPHINPEAIHWSKAEDDIARLGERFGKLGLTFWSHLDHVGDYFQDASGTESLVSFNLIDATMSLVQEKEMIKYLYHHQEALWNRIFSEYAGRKLMEDLIVNNFDKGYIDIAQL